MPKHGIGDPETFEQRSCLRKTRYSTEPTLTDDYYRTYECEFCNGWHLATSAHRKRGDVYYTEEGWPIVPVCQ